MSSVSPRPRWRFLLTPKWLGWHAFAVAATIGMLWLGDWQFHRAESGNPLSWAYTFEWPIFAIFGVAFWVKTIRDEIRPSADVPEPGEAAEADLPAGRAARLAAAAGADQDPADGQETDDPELAAYNAYLARLNQQAESHGRWHGPR